MSNLAIVIPAYKKQFFAETLDCFVNQTNQDFHIYIGDDHSPDNLEELISPYRDKLPITYHRFETNIGAEHIVNQWERCVELTGDEEWIWIFSDDDLVDPDAVEAFRTILSDTGGNKDIYSFNTCVINRVGDVMSNPPEVPPAESSEEMAWHLLMGKRANCMPDHIFSRAVYQAYGGFVKTRYGQGADWANSILFSSRNGSCIIPGAMVYWRYSGENISSLASRHKTKMIGGHFQFIRWILDHFSYLRKTDPAQFEKIREAALQNLISVIDYHYNGVPLSGICYFAWFLKRRFNLPCIRIAGMTATMNAWSMQVARKRRQNQ